MDLPATRTHAETEWRITGGWIGEGRGLDTSCLKGVEGGSGLTGGSSRSRSSSAQFSHSYYVDTGRLQVAENAGWEDHSKVGLPFDYQQPPFGGLGN